MDQINADLFIQKASYAFNVAAEAELLSKSRKTTEVYDMKTLREPSANPLARALRRICFSMCAR